MKRIKHYQIIPGFLLAFFFGSCGVFFNEGDRKTKAKHLVNEEASQKIVVLNNQITGNITGNYSVKKEATPAHTTNPKYSYPTNSKDWNVNKTEEFDMGIADFFFKDSIIKRGNTWYMNFINRRVKLEQFFEITKDAWAVGPNDEFRPNEKRNLGLDLNSDRTQNIYYKQFYKGIEVLGGDINIRFKNGYVEYVFAKFFDKLSIDVSAKTNINAISDNLKNEFGINYIKDVKDSLYDYTPDYIIAPKDGIFLSAMMTSTVRFSFLDSNDNAFIGFFSTIDSKLVWTIPLDNSVTGSGYINHGNKVFFDVTYRNGEYYLEDNKNKIYTYDLQGKKYQDKNVIIENKNKNQGLIDETKKYSKSVVSKVKNFDSIFLLTNISFYWPISLKKLNPGFYFVISDGNSEYTTSVLKGSFISALEFNLNSINAKLPISAKCYLSSNNSLQFSLNLSLGNNTFSTNNGYKGTYNVINVPNPAVAVHWGTITTKETIENLDLHFGNWTGFDGYNPNEIFNFVNWKYGEQARSLNTLDCHKGMLIYGLGSSTYNPMTSLDIVAHEYAHQITNFRSGLFYSNESGALNESFSDIAAAYVKYKQYGNVNNLWLCGDSILKTGQYRFLRSMKNPKIGSNPNTYNGAHWSKSSNSPKLANDFGGVHNNSSVNNYWFYLLTEGTKGITLKNDLNKSYSFNGIGIDTAFQIAFRNFTVNLGPCSDYYDACINSVEAVTYLYQNNNELNKVIQSWYAIGLLNDNSNYCSGVTTLSNCKGRVEDGSGPNFNYQNNLECNWIINVESANNYSIYFDNNNYGLASGDTLYFYQDLRHKKLLYKYDIYNPPPSYLLNINSKLICIKFKSNNASVSKGWAFNYYSNGTNNCIDGLNPSFSEGNSFCNNVIFNNYKGEITDGSDTFLYNNYTNCQFLIKPPGATNIVLTWSMFRTQLNNDTVTIYDGGSDTCKILGTYSGTSIPPSDTSSTGQVLITFKTDGDTTDKGWQLQYKAAGTPYCDGTTTYTNSIDSFSDGSGPNKDYYNNSDCFKRIKLSGNKFISAYFDSFDLQESSHDGLAIYDYIAIYDGDSSNADLIGVYSGRSIPETIMSSGNSLYFHFHSDENVTAKGFKLKYEAVQGPYCSGTRLYRNKTGKIKDGSDTAKYGVGSHCFHKINVENASSIVLKFSSFSTDTFGDRIIVYDGSDIYSPVLAEYSGKNIPSDSLVSSYGEMLIEFYSNDTTTSWDSGFSANYYANIAPSGSNGAITGYEYWFDTDTVRNYVKIAAVNRYTLNTDLSTENLKPGLHSLHMRFKDREDAWSSVISDYFQKAVVDTGAIRKITAYEYWYDNKESLRKFTAVSPIQNFELAKDLSTDSLKSGLHSVQMRFKNGSGAWSCVISDYFQKSIDTASNKISFYEYWYDTIYSGRQSNHINPNLTDYTLDENTNANLLAKGQHQFHARFKATNGLWSAVTNDTFVKRGLFLLDTGLKTFCANDTLLIRYSKRGVYKGSNTFTFQLSDTSGNFTTVKTIGIKNDSIGSSNDSIKCFIPANIAFSKKYKLRAISSNEKDTSNILSTLTINSPPSATLTLSGPSKFCAGDSVLLSTNTGTGYSYKWFKNDTLISNNSHKLKITQSGKFKVKVTNPNACYSVSRDTFITVYPRAIAAFYINKDTQCQKYNTFIFTDNSTIASGSYTKIWHFGDGTKSGTTNLKKYPNSGSYSVKLLLTSNFGCKDSLQKTVTIHPMPKPGFIVNKDKQCFNGNNFKYSDTTNKTLIGYNVLWNFGDGTTSSTSNPSKQFLTSDTFYNALYITTVNLCLDTISKPLIVLPSPKALFTIDSVKNCLNSNLIVLRDTSKISEGALMTFWQLGDNTTSNSPSVLKKYNSVGNYSIRLISASLAACTDTASSNISIWPNPKSRIKADSAMNCFNSNSIQFTDSSRISNGTLSRYWQFGDGTSSNAMVISKKYDTIGYFKITLISTSSKNCSDTSDLKVSIWPNPESKIQFDSTLNCFNSNEIRLSDISKISKGSVSSLWQFGDGKSSTLTSVNKRYDTSGNFKINLISSSNKNCADTSDLIVNIWPNPKSNFSIQDDDQCFKNNLFIFSNISSITSGTVQYHWAFGDLDSSAANSPQKSYSIADSLFVRLICKSAHNCTDTIQKRVYIRPQPLAIFSINDSTQCLDSNMFIFTNSSSVKYGNFINYWAFGNTDTSSDKNPTHTYSIAGNFVTTLKIASNYGCTDTTALNVSVYPTPIITTKFSGDSIVCAGDSITINATGANSYMWSNSFIGNPLVIKSSGKYFTRGTDSNLCKANSDTLNAVIYPLSTKPLITKVGNDSLKSSFTTGNQWLKNKALISGATNQYYHYNSKGTYSISYTDSNGCSQLSDSIIISSLSGITKISDKNEVNIYPNPTEGIIHINFSQPYDGPIIVMDVLGKRIIEYNSKNETTVTLALSNIAYGIYYIRIDGQVYKVMKL